MPTFRIPIEWRTYSSQPITYLRRDEVEIEADNLEEALELGRDWHRNADFDYTDGDIYDTSIGEDYGDEEYGEDTLEVREDKAKKNAIEDGLIDENGKPKLSTNKMRDNEARIE